MSLESCCDAPIRGCLRLLEPVIDHHEEAAVSQIMVTTVKEFLRGE
jgi:hypothetical protein